MKINSVKNIFFLVLSVICLNVMQTAAQTKVDTAHVVRKMALKSFRTVAVNTAAVDGTDFRIDLAQGDMQLQALYKGESNGIGDHLFRLYTTQGELFTVSSYQPFSGSLIADIGTNYSIDGTNGEQQYARVGTKKAPFIRFNAEEGSVSLFGENGTGGDFRPPSINLGVYVKGNGAVGIGTTAIPADGKIAIEGKLYAREVVVNSTTWSDYVFKPDYHLAPLKAVEAYINKNGHLPDVPSEVEVETKGINVAQMNSLLLKKIEELTLHLIDQDKRLKKQDVLLKKLINNKTAKVSAASAHN